MKDNYPKNFTNEEMMVVAAAREIVDKEVVFLGTGRPLVAGSLAKRTHAPRARMILETGIIDFIPLVNPVSISDPGLKYKAAKTSGVFYAVSLLQRGYVDIGLLGGAEVDKYGNLNSTVIGNYSKPKVRLPGSGGANDFASHAKRTVILMPHEKRRFPEKVSYITSPGFIDGPGGRKKAGLKAGGPSRVITDMAVLGFSHKSKEMQLESIHPGVSVKQIMQNTGFKLIIPKKICTTEPPTLRQLEVLRSRSS